MLPTLVGEGRFAIFVWGGDLQTAFGVVKDRERPHYVEYVGGQRCSDGGVPDAAYPSRLCCRDVLDEAYYLR